MTPILPPTRARGLEINHRGQKEGVNVKLRGVDPPSQNGKQTGYIIKPSSAKAGENISVNGGGGLIIRARNDKRQTITARSTPDNQLQVQVGQGKSAVQLSIQVTPQGKRGEVELECVRNREGDGDTTGYTVQEYFKAHVTDMHVRQKEVLVHQRGEKARQMDSGIIIQRDHELIRQKEAAAHRKNLETTLLLPPKARAITLADRKRVLSRMLPIVQSTDPSSTKLSHAEMSERRFEI
ncbi:hypothetical protein R1sor_012356 [Riccia sorocarpa]|uniref:Uncharacterized protein n=1 Tax=Riccia sorocarpa TaxID=122646 RepID=A0ABD3I3J5_9MARC